MKRFVLFGFVCLISLSFFSWGGGFEASAQGCTAPNWEGRFYNNPELSGQPVYSLCSPVIDFNWGANAPAPAVPIDEFSARFTSTQTLGAAGLYQFTLSGQDGLRLSINGQVLIDAFENVQASRTLNATYEAPAAGTVIFIALEFVNYQGDADLKLIWALTSGGVAPPPPNQSNRAYIGVGDGIPFFDGGSQPWSIQYFDNPTFEGLAAALDSAPPDGISRNYGAAPPYEGLPAQNWSARWARVVRFPGGVYTFTLRADDGARVLINEQEILNQPEFDEGQNYVVTVEIPDGDHLITVEHFDVNQDANLFLTWDPPIGTTLFPDGCNGQTAGINGSAAPCPDRGVALGSGNLPVVVRAGPLRFRPRPSQNAPETRMLSQGEQYIAIGRTADNVWLQISVDGVIGWSMREFLTLNGDPEALPVTVGGDGAPLATNPTTFNAPPAANNSQAENNFNNAPPPQAPSPQAPTPAPPSPEPPPAMNPTGVQAVALGNMRLRTAPNENADRVGDVPWGATVEVVGRSRDGLWLLIQFNGARGWSARQWYEVNAETLNTVPLID